MAAPLLAYGRITTSDGLVIFGPTFSQRDGWHWRIEDARGPTTIAPWAEGDEMGGVLDRYRKGLEGWSEQRGWRAAADVAGPACGRHRRDPASGA